MQIPDIRLHSEHTLCTNTFKIFTTQILCPKIELNTTQWPSLSYLEWFAISEKWFACFEICERAIVYINLRRSEQQRRETAFGKNVDYDLSQIRTNLRIPQDYHEILINPFFFHPMNQTKTAQNYNVSVRFELKSPLSVFSYSVQSNLFYLKIGANAKVVTETWYFSFCRTLDVQKINCSKGKNSISLRKFANRYELKKSNNQKNSAKILACWWQCDVVNAAVMKW